MSERTVAVHTRGAKFQQTVEIGPHTLIADEPKDAGGDDLGPSPFEWVAAGLGTCTSMTVKMYADRKAWKLDHVDVNVKHEKQGDAHVLKREIHFEGTLTDEERARLLEIANKCPVHKMLTGEIRIESRLV